MSDLRPLPALLKKNRPIPVRRRSEPNFFVQMFLAVYARGRCLVWSLGSFLLQKMRAHYPGSPPWPARAARRRVDRVRRRRVEQTPRSVD